MPTTIHLELRDAGRRLNLYGSNPLAFSFNIGEQIKGESGSIVLSADVIHHAVNSLLQGTTKLQSISPEQINGTYTRQHGKKVPVRLVADITPAPQHQLVGQPVLQTQKVTIYGSSEQLSQVDSVATQVLVLKDVKDSVATRVRLEEIPGIRFEQNEVEVQIVTEQFTEKVVTKSVIAKNVPEDAHLRLFPAEVSVMLRIGVTHFNEIDEKDVEVSCDFPNKPTDKLPLHVTCRSPYVTLTRCNPAAVEFLIEQTKKTSDK
jgi:YbbR domain-containing protein